MAQYDRYDTTYGVDTLAGKLKTTRQKAQDIALADSQLPEVLKQQLMAREKMLPLLQSEQLTATDEQNTQAPRARAELVGKVTNPFLIEDSIASTESRLGNRLSELKNLAANRQQSIQDIITRAGDTYGRQVKSAENEANNLSTDYQTALTQAQAKRAQAFEGRFDDLTRQEKLASIGATNRSNRGSGSGADSEFALSLANAQEAIASGKNPDQVMSQMLGAFPSKKSAIDAALSGAGYSSKAGSVGGLNFYGPGGKAISAEQYASATGKTLDQVLAGSSNPQDVSRVQAIIAQKSKTDAASMNKLKTPNWWQKITGLGQ
jgi:hypothetical protein